METHELQEGDRVVCLVAEGGREVIRVGHIRNRVATNAKIYFQYTVRGSIFNVWLHPHRVHRKVKELPGVGDVEGLIEYLLED